MGEAEKLERCIFMVKHYIILSSSYTLGKRIALHYVLGDDGCDLSCIGEDMAKIQEQCGVTAISTHLIVTDSSTWESVGNYDAFFADVELIETVDQFVYLVKMDRVLRKEDVKRYIISFIIEKKVMCGKRKLELLSELSYLEYEKNNNDMLYEIKNEQSMLRERMENYYQSKDALYNVEDDDILDANYAYMPEMSRILFAENGMQKLNCINKTIQKYQEYSEERLISLTQEMKQALLID